MAAVMEDRSAGLPQSVGGIRYTSPARGAHHKSKKVRDICAMLVQKLC